MVTFIVLFSASQTFGGLVGSSFYSSYQQMRTQHYQAEIMNDLPLTSPQVEQRLETYNRSAHIYTLDPQLQQNQALRTLNQAVTKEAQVRAYNDVIFLNQIFAVMLFFGGYIRLASTVTVIIVPLNMCKTIPAKTQQIRTLIKTSRYRLKFSAYREFSCQNKKSRLHLLQRPHLHLWLHPVVN